MISDTIWMGYPCGRFVSSLTVFVSLLFNKKLVLPIYDLPVEQARDLRKSKQSVFRKIELKLLEKVLVWKADILILAVPDFINYIRPRTSSIVVFPSGICEDQLVSPLPLYEKGSNKYVVTYAGSLDRGGMIERISSIFSDIDEWELWIAGNDCEHIEWSQNTKYFGVLPYTDVPRFHKAADAIIIPYPRKEYYMICIPLKIGEILSSCKPLITMRLPSIEKYIEYVGLENNVIFVDEWSKPELEKALSKARSIEIDVEDTLKKVARMSWEKRTKELLDAVDEECRNHSTLEWI